MNEYPRHYGQKGAALLLMLMVVILALTSVILVNLNSDEVQIRQQTDTQKMLATAKDALLQYAVLNPSLQPGQPHGLPCPDIDETGGYADGEAHTNSCGSQYATVMGQLPWRTLGLPALKDSSAACLWYVVSGGHKIAATATPEMLNGDSNGQLQLYSVDTGTILAGTSGADRPIALVFAGMSSLQGQTRPGSGATQCSPAARAAQFLDTDTGTGISNAAIAGVPDGVDLFAVATDAREEHNDRVIVISRDELSRAMSGGARFESDMRELGLAVTQCVANYGANNPGGVNDARLPWPALVELSDYRADVDYDDTNTGTLSGRLPDIVDDSNAMTANSISRVLTDCDNVAVPTWTPVMAAKWQHWKDHFFYAVAGSFAPSAGTPSSCTDCISVNGVGTYAAVILFANTRLDTLSQVRDAPPNDADTKLHAANYLEDSNAAIVPSSIPAPDFASQAPTSTFNDFVFCIDSSLSASEC